MSNIFAINGSEIATPKLDQCGVAGIMRGVVIEVAQSLGYQVSEQRISVAQLKQAEQLCCTNSIIGIWPIRRFEDVHYAVGRFDQQLLEGVMALGFSHEQAASR